jgi:hypothetical protein
VLEKHWFLALRFSRKRRKGYAVKNLAEALHTEGFRYKLLVSWEGKTEILDKLLITLLNFPSLRVRSRQQIHPTSGQNHKWESRFRKMLHITAAETAEHVGKVETKN